MMENVFTDGQNGNNGNQSPTDETVSPILEDMQQLSLAAGAGAIGICEDREETKEASTSIVNLSGGEFAGAQIGSTNTYNFTKQESGDTHQYYQTTTNIIYQGATGGDFEEDDLTKTKKKKDLAPGWIELSDSICMNPNHKISTVGNIYYGEQRSSIYGTRPIAIKSLEYLAKNKEEAKTLLKLSSHPNVVTILHSDIYKFGHVCIYIAMELCHTQNLHDHVTENNNNNVPFDPQLSISQAKQLVEGLSYIHSNDIVHRDLKPYNVLFSLDKKTLKIADFGISRKMTSGRTVTNVTNARAGTDGYRAPETYNSNKISKQTDIFSLGLVIYFLWSNGHHAFGDDPDDWNSNIKKNRDRDLSQMLVTNKAAAEHLISAMLEFKPERRPRASDILQHVYFQKFTAAQGAEEIKADLPSSSCLPEKTPSSVPQVEKSTMKGGPSISAALEQVNEEDEPVDEDPTEQQSPLSPEETANIEGAVSGALNRGASVMLVNPNYLHIWPDFIGSEEKTRMGEAIQSSEDDHLDQTSTVDDQEKEGSKEKVVLLPPPPVLYAFFAKGKKRTSRNETESKADVDDLDTLLQIAECNMMSNKPYRDKVDAIISVCQSLCLSPEYVKSIAEDYFKKSLLVRAYITYTCAVTMYKSVSSSSEVLEDLDNCNWKMKEIATQMIKRGKMTDIISKHVLPFMKNMLADFHEIKNLSVEIIEASCTLSIGLSHSDASQYKEALKQYEHGIHLMERVFRQNASKHKVYADLAHNIGVATFNTGGQYEAIIYLKKSINSKQIVEDFGSEEERKESLSITTEVLEEIENQRLSSASSDHQKTVPERSHEEYGEFSSSYRTLYNESRKQMKLEKKLSIVLQMARCQVGCERSFEGELKEITVLYKDLLQNSPCDVKSGADDKLDKLQLVEAYVMYVAASKMYREESHNKNYKSSVIISAIASCIEQLNKITKELLKKSVTMRIAIKTVIPSMYEMLIAIKEVKDLLNDKKVKKEASFLNRIGRIHDELGEHQTALDFFEKGLGLMKRGFGASISDAWIHGGLLHNMGVTYQNQGIYEQAIMMYKTAIKAKENAKDYSSLEERSNNIKRSIKTLQACEIQMQKANMPSIASIMPSKLPTRLKVPKQSRRKARAEQEPLYEEVLTVSSALQQHRTSENRITDEHLQPPPDQIPDEDLYESVDDIYAAPALPPRGDRDAPLLPPRHDAIFLQESSESFWQKKEYLSALPILQKLFVRQTDTEQKLETLLQIHECQIMSDFINFDLFPLQEAYETRKLSSRDLTEIAAGYFSESYLIRSYFAYVCVCRIYPCTFVDEIQFYICKLGKVVEEMAKQVSLEKIALKHVIPSMYELLADLRGLEGIPPDSKVQNEAGCLNDIGLAYDSLNEQKRALDVYRAGIELMEKQFRSDASKFQLYERMLKKIGVIDHNLMKEVFALSQKSTLAANREVYTKVELSIKTRSVL